jgi:pimeloyl-ACP methyl ester carboxylesterase
VTSPVSSLPQSLRPGPVLTGAGAVDAAKAAVLVLHGGRANSSAATSNRQLAVARMLPIANHLVQAGAGAGLAVYRLRFGHRGWNRTGVAAIEDTSWAIEQLRQRHGEIPIVLVGHSMGGRAAMRVAGNDAVTGVVGLAPWLVPGEPHEQFEARRLLVVHGTVDRTTSWRGSRSFVREVRPIAIESGWIGLHGSGHGLLRRSRLVNELTADFVLHAAFGVAPTGAVAQALSGRGTEISI